MQKTWEIFKDYYINLGNSYHVNPVIFLGIHIIATPLFIVTIAWLVKNYKKKKSIAAPLTLSVFLFNAANVYLVLFGKNIPWWVYGILIITTLISGYFSYKKIKKKISSA
jgi:hypothetical protein